MKYGGEGQFDFFHAFNKKESDLRHRIDHATVKRV